MSPERLLGLALANPVNAQILAGMPRLGLPDLWLTGGAVFQSVWNGLCGRDPTAGIRDYDLFYFDGEDLSAAAEAAVASRMRGELGLGLELEVSNQARVHLWYEAEHGVPAPAFSSSREAIDHFVAPACAVGLSVDAAGEVVLYAPFGLADVLDMRVRPNPRLATRTAYAAKCARWAAEWPQLEIIGWGAAG